MGIKHSIVPCATREYPTAAIRPVNSILENRGLKNKGLNIMEYWETDLDEYVLQAKTQLINEAKSSF